MTTLKFILGVLLVGYVTGCRESQAPCPKCKDRELDGVPRLRTITHGDVQYGGRHNHSDSFLYFQFGDHMYFKMNETVIHDPHCACLKWPPMGATNRPVHVILNP